MVLTKLLFAGGGVVAGGGALASLGVANVVWVDKVAVEVGGGFEKKEGLTSEWGIRPYRWSDGSDGWSISSFSLSDDKEKKWLGEEGIRELNVGWSSEECKYVRTSDNQEVLKEVLGDIGNHGSRLDGCQDKMSQMLWKGMQENKWKWYYIK